MSPNNDRDQVHPLEKKDRDIVNSLLQGEATDYNLAELARLTMRYNGFPGARDIQQDLQRVLDRWQLTKDELCQRTLQIHHHNPVYKTRGEIQDQQDWS
jgi:Protein of unknown function (DUF3288)